MSLVLTSTSFSFLVDLILKTITFDPSVLILAIMPSLILVFLKTFGWQNRSTSHSSIPTSILQKQTIQSPPMIELSIPNSSHFKQSKRISLTRGRSYSASTCPMPSSPITITVETTSTTEHQSIRVKEDDPFFRLEQILDTLNYEIDLKRMNSRELEEEMDFREEKGKGFDVESWRLRTFLESPREEMYIN